MNLSEDDWKKKLTPEQYKVLREKGTEPPFSGKYVMPPDSSGVYHCMACGNSLFSSDSQYESTTPGLIGWPSFADVVDNESIELNDDTSLGMKRIEVTCANCGSHLGHLFPDESSPSSQHYCINSCSLDFKPVKKAQ